MLKGLLPQRGTQRKDGPIGPVDFVVTWVDDSDDEWLAERDRYAKEAGEQMSLDGNAAAMYQDYGTLRHWFRAVENYAPWVRKIHFVTAGHVPGWLNTENPKLNLVSHADIVDEKNLPTFNPRAIQAGFENIEDLSEHFVVFDDDTLLNQPVIPEFFFPKGLPYGMALPNALALRSSHSHALLNVAGVMNENFRQRDVLKKHWRKWLSPKYGLELYRSFSLLPWPYILPFAISHLPVPVAKSSMGEAFAAARHDLEETSARRFRDPRDMLPIQLAAAWQAVTGQFTPVGRASIGQSFDLADNSVEEMVGALGDAKTMTVCFNDSTKEDTTAKAEALRDALEIKLPTKSSFER